MSQPPPIVLTFAASDPTGGAGLQADLLTLAALGCHPLSVRHRRSPCRTRAASSRSTRSTARWSREQARALLADMQVAAFKLGVLGSADNARAIAAIAAEHSARAAGARSGARLGARRCAGERRGDRARCCEALVPRATVRHAEQPRGASALGGARSACSTLRLRATCSSPARTTTRRRGGQHALRRAAAWCARTAGRACRAATTARAARSPPRSPPRSPRAAACPRRCARRRSTPGRRSPPASAAGAGQLLPDRFFAPMMRGLYAITPDMADTGAARRKVEQALEGGIALLQYRNKIISKDKRLLQARELAPLARGYGVPFIVNDDVELALAVGADGVHLGQGRRRPRRPRAPSCRAGSSAPPATTTSSGASGGRAPAPTTSPSAACSPRRPSPARCARRSRSSRSDARRAAVRDRRHHAGERAAADRRRRRPARGDLRSVRRARHRALRARAIPQALPMKKNQQLFERAQRAHPRRRQFAGARLPRRRRHAACSSSAPRAPTSGTPTASATSTTSAPGARCSPATRHPAVVEAVQEARRARAVLRRADRGRDRARRAALPPGALARAGAPGVLGHRGDDDRAPPGARLHRPQR